MLTKTEVTTETVAKEKLAQINAAKEEKANKASPEGKASPEQKPDKGQASKTPEQEAKERADAQASEEKRILESDDSKLSDADKTKKKDIVEKKSKAEAEDKINRRFGELTGKIKDLEKSDKAKAEELDRLRKEKSELESKLAPRETPEELIKKAEEARIKKYLEEDKSKPREERRELSEEELSEWLVEDYAKANRWLARNENRREREREHDRVVVARKSDMEKFSTYMKEGLERHPELDTTRRVAELKSQGKTDAEIKDTILGENPKVKLVLEILKEHPEYLRSVEGPKLACEELEKRLANVKPDAKSDAEKEQLRAEVERLRKETAEKEAELKRRDGIDSDTRSSRREDDKPPAKKLTELEEEEDKIRRRARISKDRLSAIKDRRAGIKNANVRESDDI